jgi:flagellar basal body-associated protein FliL
MKQKDILIIIILLFVFVAVWIGYTIYSSLTKSQLPESIQLDIESIQPVFDGETIEQLKQRQQISPSFETNLATPSPVLEFPDEIASDEIDANLSIPEENPSL